MKDKKNLSNYNITAYSSQIDKHVDLCYDSLEEAQKRNPNLKNFRFKSK